MGIMIKRIEVLSATPGDEPFNYSKVMVGDTVAVFTYTEMRYDGRVAGWENGILTLVDRDDSSKSKYIPFSKIKSIDVQRRGDLSCKYFK